MCVASLVLGIISLVFFCIWYISVPCAIIAIALGAVAGKSGKNGMAKAGLIMGIIAIALVVVFWILAIIGLSVLGDELNKYNFS